MCRTIGDNDRKKICASAHDAPSPATASATAIAKKICAPVHDAPTRPRSGSWRFQGRSVRAGRRLFRAVTGESLIFAGVNPGAGHGNNDDLID